MNSNGFTLRLNLDRVRIPYTKLDFVVSFFVVQQAAFF